MAEYDTTDKSPNGDVDLTSISAILGVIAGAFRTSRKPANSIPPPLLLVGSKMRPGMSARNLAARQISRRQENGEQMGDVFNDGPNRVAQGIVSDAEETVSMIQTESKVDVIINPGAIQVTSTGSAGPIPVVTQGANILYVSGSGGVS